ncbi:unnamed protein product [Calypogeia fissa]
MDDTSVCKAIAPRFKESAEKYGSL